MCTGRYRCGARYFVSPPTHPFLPYVAPHFSHISEFNPFFKGTGREIPFIMFDFYNVDKPFSQDEPTFKKSALQSG